MFETENRTPPTLDGMKSELERRKATRDLMEGFLGGLLDAIIEHETDPAKKANMTILKQYKVTDRKLQEVIKYASPETKVDSEKCLEVSTAALTLLGAIDSLTDEFLKKYPLDDYADEREEPDESVSFKSSPLSSLFR